LSTDNPEDLKIVDNSVSLRVQEHISGINAVLSVLCAQVGFDPGTLSFDAVKGLKTATEVISENSKTFGTVKAHENILKDALEQMVRAILDLSVRYGISYKGRPVAELISGGFSVSVKFDDSIVQDRTAEVNEGTMLVGAGLMSKKKFMTDTLGYTPEKADEELAQIAAEGKMNAVEVTRLFGDMA
jgi:A118 family predicted phage portal protein